MLITSKWWTLVHQVYHKNFAPEICKTKFIFKVLTLDFEWFSSEVHCELETKTVSNFLHFLISPTVMSQFLFLTIDCS